MTLTAAVSTSLMARNPTMKKSSRYNLTLGIAVVAIIVSGCARTKHFFHLDELSPTPATARPAASVVTTNAAPSAAASNAAPHIVLEDIKNLPGKGLLQHDFIFTGEFDTRKKVQTISLVQGGKVTKTYQIPTTDPATGQLSEFSDMHRLSNGDVLYAYKTGWRKVDANGNLVYDFKCPVIATNTDGKLVYCECHSAQPIGTNHVLFMLNGMPAKLCMFNIHEARVEWEHVMQTKEPVDAKSIHGEFRNVRMTGAGTFLIAHMNLGKVIEYDTNWNVIWTSTNAPSVWQAARLKNGNTLVSGNQNCFVREISPEDKIVWQFGNDDLKGTGIRLFGVHQCERLQNGDTVLCNWVSGTRGLNKTNDWPKTVQAIEVTPDKKVVWALREWKDPDLGTGSEIQMLDEPGNPVEENQELMR